jgi:hypothetical protein
MLERTLERTLSLSEHRAPPSLPWKGRRRQWVPMMNVAPDYYRWSGSSLWTPTAPLRSWEDGLHPGAKVPVMSPRSVESVIKRLSKAHRPPPKSSTIRVHSAAPLRRTVRRSP